MCNAGEHLLRADKQEEAGSYFRRARGVAEAHGFFSVECRACKNLGKVAMLERRPEEGVEMLRHALVGLATLIPKPETRNPNPPNPNPPAAASLVENPDSNHEMDALRELIGALIMINASSIITGHLVEEVSPHHQPSEVNQIAMWRLVGDCLGRCTSDVYYTGEINF